MQPPPTHTESLNRKLKSRYQLFLLQEKLYYIHSLEASSMLKLMATILLSVERGISEEPSVFPALPLNQHDITAQSKAHIPWIEEHSISLLPKLLFQNIIFHLLGGELEGPLKFGSKEKPNLDLMISCLCPLKQQRKYVNSFKIVTRHFR